MTILIIFKDNTRMKISNVDNYSYNADTNMFKFVSKACNNVSFMPRENVKYIGDLKNTENSNMSYYLK